MNRLSSSNLRANRRCRMERGGAEEIRVQSGRGEGLISRSSAHCPLWPTVDGPLGLSEEDSLSYARKFFKFGFLLLPWLWAINCFYFWPVLRHPRSFSLLLRRYVVRSAIGFVVFTVALVSWAVTFMIGGERVFGRAWEGLVMYNVADELDLTGWS